MKINNADEILKGVYKEATPKSHKTGDKQFAEILKETLAPSCKNKPVSQSHPVYKGAPLANIQPVSTLAEDKNAVAEHISKYLDLLDDYRRKLQDPQVSLKAVDPVINRLETEKEYLKPVLETLADGDELKEILNNVLITASLEIINYRQGIYNNP